MKIPFGKYKELPITNDGNDKMKLQNTFIIS